MGEIGGEFQLNSATAGTNDYLGLGLLAFERQYVLSGRTGFALLADELIIKQNIKTIALPAYCCATMIYPFLKKGIEVVFYPNFFECEEFDSSYLSKVITTIEIADAVLIMDYFGFIRNTAWNIASLAKNACKTIIVDATQTAFSVPRTYGLADYIIVSYRKWSDLLCAAVFSKHGFITDCPIKPFDRYLRTWRQASENKHKYLISGNGDKLEFLRLYGKANSLLTKAYEGFLTSSKELNRLRSTSSEQLIHKRRKNAAYLIGQIKQIARGSEVSLLFDTPKCGDCPLFVPVLVNPQKRAGIQQYLAEKDVYCPAHWPIDRSFPHKETYYHGAEISLVCDQRYNLNDMERQVNVFKAALRSVQ